jgi:hypothetical protein
MDSLNSHESWKAKSQEDWTPEDWEQMLGDAGTPAEIGIQKVAIIPQPISIKDVLAKSDIELSDDWDSLLEIFESFHNKEFQQGILTDLENKRKQRIPATDILERCRLLILQSQKLEGMKESDKKYIPPEVPTNDEDSETFATRVVEQLFERMGSIIDEHQSPESGKKETIN